MAILESALRRGDCPIYVFVVTSSNLGQQTTVDRADRVERATVGSINEAPINERLRVF